MSDVEQASNLDSGIFRAYDIRGITTQNLTEDVVYWIGRSFATAALAEDQQTAVVGAMVVSPVQDLKKPSAAGCAKVG